VRFLPNVSTHAAFPCRSPSGSDVVLVALPRRSASVLAVPGLARADGLNAAPIDAQERVKKEPHRVVVSVGYASAKGNIDPEGDHTFTAPAGSFRVGYAYEFVPWFEGGADVTYWAAPGTPLAAVIPAVALRPHIPIGGRFEVGVTARVGLLIWPQPARPPAIHGPPRFAAAHSLPVWLIAACADCSQAPGTGRMRGVAE